MLSVKRLVLGGILALAAVSSWASNFRAADQVYMTAVARIPTAAGTFKTDIVITNMSDSTVDVDMALSQGSTGTANAVATANLKRVATLAPRERKELVDFLAALYPGQSPFGQAIFFACRQGGNCTDCNNSPADCKLISVEGRIYVESTANCPRGAASCTSGQLFSGIPFYNYVSSQAADKGLDKVTIVGLRQTCIAAPGQSVQTTCPVGFRSNLGFANASNTTSTTLLVKLFANNSPSSPVAQATVNLGPLGHQQSNMTSLFPSGYNLPFSGFVTVEQQSFTPNPGETDPVPGFLAYGSILDNSTDDPTTLEAQYFQPLDYSCVYGSKPEKRAIKR